MNIYLVVFLGAGCGGVLRHIVNVIVPKLVGTAIPYHTLTVNVLGSLIMGLAAGYFAFRGNSPQEWRLFLMTGVLGGFTTFSAFSLDAALLYERGEIATMAIYVLTSVGVSILALFAGLYFIRSLS